MEVLGILISLGLLMFFAYRGFSVIFFAPIFALVGVALSSGLGLMPSYTEIFMTKLAEYVKTYFPVFMLGAVFGKLMEESGLAKSISGAIIRGIGKERAILAVILAGCVLTYGGVSLFVVVFAVYPLAAVLYREANIPKRLIPGSIAIGAFTATMDAFPGTPQIQNVIPTTFFGTSIYAAPTLGVIGGLIVIAGGYTYMNRQLMKARANGEGYGNHTTNEPVATEKEENLPHWILAVLPLAAVLLLNLFLSNPFKWSWGFTWDPAVMVPFKNMGLSLFSGTVAKVQTIWSLVIALTVGTALAALFGMKRMPPGGLAKAINAGAIGSLLAVLNTASEYGYGAVVSSLAGFAQVKQALMSIQIGSGPLVSEAISVNILAGITGSASGGMTIALGMLGKTYLEMANAIGMSPEILHRVASMASGGMDTLPHNGAVITLLAVCGLTHKDSYKDIFVITVLKTLTVFIIIALHTFTGIL